jgi:hypothetical protein
MFDAGKLRRATPAVMVVAAVIANGCDGSRTDRGGALCPSGVGWHELVDVPAGEQSVTITACLAEECLSREIPVRDGTAAAPCIMDDIRARERFMSVCAYRLIGGDALADAGGDVRIHVDFVVEQPGVDGLADGDDASLVVATPDGTPVYEIAGPVTYLVSSDTAGNRCMQGRASWTKHHDSGAGDPP